MVDSGDCPEEEGLCKGEFPSVGGKNSAVCIVNEDCIGHTAAVDGGS